MICKRSKVVSLFLTAAMTVALAAGMSVFAYAGTTVSINSQADMNNWVSSGSKAAGTVVELNCDVSVTSAISSFAGTFDGNGHTIALGTRTFTNSYAGFIGSNSGVLSDFTVTGAVTGNCSNGDYLAAVAGYNSGTITNVINQASVTSVGMYNTGGIAGFNTGTIAYCTNNALVNSNISKVGGITGENAGTVNNCSNKANVTSSYSGKNGIGGIVGRNGNNNTATETGIIKDCINSGNITCSNGKWVGGIAGFQNSLSSTINCTNTGTVTGYGYVGNLVGNDEGTTS